MNIEQMAREAGFTVSDVGIFRDRQTGPFSLGPELERFSALVRADAERKLLTELRDALDAHGSIDTLRFTVNQALRALKG